ncbi:CapA family protein [Paracoccus sp. Z118]|uniref:CapA family protein n=1 Tax=Paracoccus sp. Z118 TaxID=2851017 RepID=UPI001C2C3031|nr:CapA family protein [Paracoccus sp. Z118]MBV0892946.1 CapA family protein [Paracoccus sp. Z118]
MLAAGNVHSRKPVVRMELRLDDGHPAEFSAGWIRKLADGMPILRDEVLDFPGWQLVREERESVPVAMAVELLAIMLQRSLGWPVTLMESLGAARRSAAPETGDRRIVVFEARQTFSGRTAGRMAADVATRLDLSPESEAATILADAFRIFRRRTAYDTPHRAEITIVSEANKRGIPWRTLPGNRFVRLGRGRQGEILRGFDTSLTSCIASNLAKRKDVTRNLLAAAGLPVPAQRTARRVDTAITCAQAIGYPVVVKPMDGSEGRAVSVNVRTDEEVAKAFAEAQTVSRVVAIEAQIPGETIRISVIGGRLFAAALRHPPRVLGDGVHTIEELIAEENKHPERQAGGRVTMDPIVLDDEMLALMAEQGVTPESVPEAGRWVLLRHVPNSPYGHKTDVTETVHPTIRTMSERVAAVMGISVCGIDFITTDISRPHHETGGAICEVNTLPDLSLHQWASEGQRRNGAVAVVDMLYPRGKRTGFPIIAVLRDEGDEAVENAIRTDWEGRGYNVAIISALGGPDGGDKDVFAERQQALDLDTEVNLGIVVLTPRQFVDWGLGYDRVELAVVQAGEGGSIARRARRALERVARGKVVALDDPDLSQRSYEAVELGRKLRPARPLVRPGTAAPPDAKAQAPAPETLPRRRKPALLAPQDDSVKRPRSGPLQTREPRLFGSGNPYARRPVAELPIIGAGTVMPALMAQTLAAILPPLSDKVSEFGGWRRISAATGPVPLAAVIEVLAVAVQRYIGWPVRFCAWRAEAEQAWPAPAAEAVPEAAAETGVGDAVAVFEIATPATGIGAAGVALSLASALLDGKSQSELQSIFLEETSALQQATGKERPLADALEIAREATRKGIGWGVVEGTNFLRLGSGRFAHVMSGTETTNTSLIGRRLAQSRAATAGILAAAGLPVPRQRFLRTEAEALEAADAVGFPVTIRPASGSKERAVTTGITGDAGVLPALHRALAVSSEAVVESFAPGDEYRLLVVGGRLTAAARRRPAQVTGDGASTIRVLVERENDRPERDRRLASRPQSLVPLALDGEAVALLAEQGLTPDSVPAHDRVVPLRRQPSGAYGGDMVDATDAVHPEIRRIAERAATVLGIDVCGIDFVTTDITRPAEETGGVICDVSTRPSLRLHYGVSEGKVRGVAGAVLEMLFKDGAPSRCPAVVLVGTGEETAELRRAAERAAARAGLMLGVVTEGVDGLSPKTRRLKDTGAIAWDKEVDAVLIHTTAAGLAEHGLGVERIDFAIIPAEDGDEGGGEVSALDTARNVLTRLSGNRILTPDDPAARRRVLLALGLARRTRKAAPAPQDAPPQPPAQAHPAPDTVAELPTDLTESRTADLPAVSPVDVMDDLSDLPTATLPSATGPLRPRNGNATFLMVGDIGFGENYMHLPRAAGLLRMLDAHGYRHSVARLEGLLSSADMVIGNLESPLSSRPDSALRGRKKYLGWSHPERTVAALVEAGIHAVSLANNHALDCGTSGLDATIARLAAAGIDGFGAGRDQGAAERPFIRRFTVGGHERSLVVFAGFEHRDRYQDRYRWYARPEAPGVSRLAAERIGERIAALRETLPAPFFVAYPHWGADYAEVSDAQREEAARLIAAGVDLVVGHGTHAAQTVEMIAGRPVVFGLGNFVWNSPGHYGKFSAQPYSLAAALVFPGKRGGGGTALRLYPIVTDNIATKFQSRPVTREEFGEAVTALTRGLRLPAKRRTDKAGRCLELRLEDPHATAQGAALAGAAVGAARATSG